VEKIEGTFRGLTYVDNVDVSIVRMAGYLNSYFFSDHSTPTKKFILTSFDNNIATGQGRRVFVEILKDENDNGWADPQNGDTTSGNYKFQYQFQ
jgi:hypothetical protein